ncbi:hypothetical protein G9A89_014315 [Geosiphon pyriformis]|nr:hypothetical protein G9A89_014315 [Geosiphon pyriformis]
MTTRRTDPHISGRCGDNNVNRKSGFNKGGRFYGYDQGSRFSDFSGEPRDQCEGYDRDYNDAFSRNCYDFADLRERGENGRRHDFGKIRPFGIRDDITSDWLPDWDVNDTEEAVTVIMEVPGIKKEDIGIEVKDGLLILQANRQYDDNLNTAESVYLREREFGKFKRRFKLPEGCDISKITAKLQDGLIEVKIPKGIGSPGIRVNIE